METKNFDDYVKDRLGAEKVEQIEKEILEEVRPLGQIYYQSSSPKLYTELFNVLWDE